MIYFESNAAEFYGWEIKLMYFNIWNDFKVNEREIITCFYGFLDYFVPPCGCCNISPVTNIRKYKLYVKYNISYFASFLIHLLIILSINKRNGIQGTPRIQRLRACKTSWSANYRPISSLCTTSWTVHDPQNLTAKTSVKAPVPLELILSHLITPVDWILLVINNLLGKSDCWRFDKRRIKWKIP